MDDDIKGIRWKIVKVRARINRGLSWLDYIRYIAYLSMSVVGLDIALKNLNIILDPSIFADLYFGLPIIFFLVAYIMGYLDENDRYGFWKLEAIWGNRNVNPVMKNIEQKIEEIHKELIKLKK